MVSVIDGALETALSNRGRRTRGTTLRAGDRRFVQEGDSHRYAGAVSMIDGCSNGRQPPDAVSRAQDGRGVALDTYSLAYTVSSLINQLFGKSRDPFWQQAYTNLVRWIIELHRRID